MRRRHFLGLSAAAAAAAACGPSRDARLPTRPDGARAALGGKVDHLVVLMLENRSYDQMLGALRGPEHDGAPFGAALRYEKRSGAAASVTLRAGAPPDSFAPDPGHNFQAVEAQIHGGGFGARADMAGFVHRFAGENPELGTHALQAYATLYADGQLPVLQTLAKEYGVCSHWFCSLPSSTAPNRLFTHAGTSGGVTRKGAYYSRVKGQLVFDKLDAREPRSFRVYFHDMPHLWLTGDAWMQALGSHFSLIDGFARDVAADRLPAYSFIEPQHILPPWSSQHPSGGVSHGERLIAHVYNALAANPAVFAKTLLVVTYDEHGGFYDHVVPPGHAGWQAQCPGIEHVVIPPDGALGRGAGREEGYGFTTLGPRVPAVVISPWIDRGSVFGWRAKDPARRVTLDHTSILATVGAMTGVWVDSKRARAATDLGVTLTRAAPRTDYIRRLGWNPDVYRGVLPVSPSSPLAGVGLELYDTWKQTNDGPPIAMIEDVHRRVLG